MAISSNSIRSFAQAESTAAFRFLRQPSRPNSPKPEVRNASVPGRGVEVRPPSKAAIVGGVV